MWRGYFLTPVHGSLDSQYSLPSFTYVELVATCSVAHTVLFIYLHAAALWFSCFQEWHLVLEASKDHGWSLFESQWVHDCGIYYSDFVPHSNNSITFLVHIYIGVYVLYSMGPSRLKVDGILRDTNVQHLIASFVLYVPHHHYTWNDLLYSYLEVF